MKLSDIKVNEKVKIVKIENCKNKLRLSEMGLVANTEVTVIRKAPFGGPVEIVLRGYHLCLRSEDAQKITVYPING